MSSRQDPDGFSRIFEPCSAEVAELARRARDLILAVFPDAYEVVWVRQGIAGYGTGPKKMTQHFAHITPFKAHCGLGFNYGSELPDPEGLLEGSGKLIRHVKLRRPEDVDRPALRALVETAICHRVPPPRNSGTSEADF